MIRIVYVLGVGLAGLVAGALAGFFSAVILNPEASPTHVFWGSLSGSLLFLWVFGCFGTILRGAFWGAIGAASGCLLGWMVGLVWTGHHPALAHWGSVLGGFCLACWPPRPGGGKPQGVPLRTHSDDREAQRQERGFEMPSASGVSLPDPPPYQSDGVKLDIRQLEAELEKVSPRMDFGKATTRRGTEVVNETEFYAADLDYLNGPFLDYVAQRMKAEGITEWTEAKFDCDDFSHYLNQCATMCILKSGHQAATHSLFMASVKINDGAELLGVGGARDAYHANNIVRCTDGQWYFIEPQTALWHHRRGNPMASALGRIAPLKKVVAACSGNQELQPGWMCPLATPIRDGGVELLQAKF